MAVREERKNNKRREIYLKGMETRKEKRKKKRKNMERK